MGPIEAVKTGYRQSFTYAGRATRSEFWWLVAFCLLIVSNVLTYGLGSVLPLSVVMIAQVGLIAVPLAACLTRRMRDAGRHPLWAVAPIVMMLIGPLMALAGLGEEAAQFMESDDETMPSTGIIVFLSVWTLAVFACVPTLVFCFLGSTHSTSDEERRPASGGDHNERT